MKEFLKKRNVIVLLPLIWLGLLAGVTAHGQEGGMPISVTGRLEVLISDDFDRETSITSYFLQVDNGPVYELQFNDNPPTHLSTGQRVTAEGYVEGNTLRVETLAEDSDPSTAMLIAGEHRAVVLIVDLQDVKASTRYSRQQLTELMYTSTRSVRDLYFQNSFGQLDLVPDGNNDGEADVFGPFLIGYSYGPTNNCDYVNWALAIETAAQAQGIDLSPYRHRIFVLPSYRDIPACGWSGRTNVGCGTWCRIWITEGDSPMTFVHELGHNLGMVHAGNDSNNDGTIDSEYGDYSDPMGGARNWHLFNAANMDRLGWYESYPGSVVTVTQSGNYTLDVLNANPPATSGNPRILKLLRPNNQGFYYLSYRQPQGYDDSLASSYIQRTQIHWYQGSGYTGTAFVSPLNDNTSFIDSAAGVEITQVGHDSDHATVSITLNAAPLVTITVPANGTGFVTGQPITFAGTAIDPEDGNLTAGLSWTSNIDGLIGTGGSFTRTLSAGTHSIQAQVTDSRGRSGSTVLTVTIIPNTVPTVAISTPSQGTVFTTEQNISFTGTATDAEEGNLTSSLNWSSNLDGSIGSGGSFTRTLSAGVHTLQAQVTDSGGLVGSAAITITVQTNTAPTVTITAPADGATFTTDQAITFTGTATDTQDGHLTATLSWTSNLDGTLGGGGTVSRKLSAGTHTLQAQATDSGGATGTATVTVKVIAPTTSTFTSIGTEDGWVLESSETSNVGGSLKASDSTGSGLLLGDSSKKYQYKSILSFDTSPLPDNALLTSATLRLQRGTLNGTSPFTTHGALLADIVTGAFNNNAALETADFQAPATATGVMTLSAAAGNGTWSEGTLNATGLAALNKTGKTQVRLYFSLDDDNDSTGDYLGYYAGEYGTAAARPQLVVNYVVNTAPTVTITAPANNLQVAPGTAITFSGSAGDAEDGTLSARLVWTSDRDGVIGRGGSFTTATLSVGIHTITATVTDGFGAQAAASLTLINSNNHVPTVTINTPTNNARFPTGQTITFSGSAGDLEDGTLTAGLQWTSSLDGPLGSGGTFSRTLSVGTHTLQAQVTDSGGFSGMATVTLTVANPTTVTLTSIGGEDGWVLESSESSNIGGSLKASDSTTKGVLLGDTNSNQQYRALLSFDTSTLPANATITAANVRLQRGTLNGTSPFSTHGTLLADIKTGGFNGNNALETADFQAAASATGVATLSTAASNGAWSEGSLNAQGLAALNRTGRTQFRLYFSLDDDNDKVADYLGYYAGEYSTAASRPQLVVTYY
ncbi:MAG: DNRLRE domain-containing protein [Candidatus Competibacteraceae bacterium]